MYAKLVNGALRRAPNKVIHNGKTVCNPKEDILAELGYQKVAYTDMPTDAPEGKHYELSWEQTDTEIIQTWTLVGNPKPSDELSAEEALAIIVGGV